MCKKKKRTKQKKKEKQKKKMAVNAVRAVFVDFFLICNPLFPKNFTIKTNKKREFF
jgi:regulator of replication initiation timing